MDTTELGGGKNPTPSDLSTKECEVLIRVTFKTTEEFLQDASDEDIENYVKSNLQEFINTSEIVDYEVEV